MYNFSAKVARGKGRGKRIGFPTINLDKNNLDIDYGVYQVEIIFNKKKYDGLLHYGPKETFNEGVSAEIYIKSFNQNIYNKTVKIKAIKKIRDIKKFNNADELKDQIKKDLFYICN